MHASPPTNRAPIRSSTNCARPAAPPSSKSTPPAPIVADPCWRACCATSRAGETLVVVRLDRLARSVSHLLAVIEQLEAAGAHFRSLRDPIDTSTPQGMFSLQVLGAVAQLERALIAERTKSGLIGRAHAAASAAIPAYAPATRTPSENCGQAATPRIWKASSCGWIPGCRPCARCVRISQG